MKYTDGTNTVEAVEYRYDRDDMLNLQRIGFYPVITDLRNPFRPRLRISKNQYIGIGGYVVRTPKGKFEGYERAEFLDKFKPITDEKDQKAAENKLKTS